MVAGFTQWAPVAGVLAAAALLFLLGFASSRRTDRLMRASREEQAAQYDYQPDTVFTGYKRAAKMDPRIWSPLREPFRNGSELETMSTPRLVLDPNGLADAGRY